MSTNRAQPEAISHRYSRSVNITSTVRKAVSPRLTERDPDKPKLSTGMENVLINTTGDIVDGASTFVVFKEDAVQRTGEDGREELRVAKFETEDGKTVVKQGWVPKDAFEEVGDAYYLPTHKFSPLSSVIGGVSRGLVTAGIPGAAAGLVGSLAAGRLPENPALRMTAGAAAGALALTAYQGALFGHIGLPEAAFAGSIAGLVAAGAGDGDATVRDAMLGGTAAGLAATMATGLPLGMLTGTAATAVGAQAGSRTSQVLLSAATGAALTTVQALITGNSLPLAAGIGAAMGAAGALSGPAIGQLGRNLQQAVTPTVAKGVNKALEGRGEKSYQVAAAVPEALAFGSLGASLGLLLPGMAPVGIAVGAAAGGLHGYQRAGKRIEQLKQLNEKRMENLNANPQ